MYAAGLDLHVSANNYVFSADTISPRFFLSTQSKRPQPLPLHVPDYLLSYLAIDATSWQSIVVMPMSTAQGLLARSPRFAGLCPRNTCMVAGASPRVCCPLKPQATGKSRSHRQRPCLPFSSSPFRALSAALYVALQSISPAAVHASYAATYVMSLLLATLSSGKCSQFSAPSCNCMFAAGCVFSI